MQPVLFNRFKSSIIARGADAANDSASILGSSGAHTVRYVPFEHVNSGARLVIVGITPGPRQMELAYEAVRALARAGADDARILLEAKREGAFGGPTMRPRLLKMLHAFGIHRILGVDDARQLWEDRSDLLHATSVVPHAAFEGETPFAGSFEKILGSPALKEMFESHFVPSLKSMNADALYVALGPTPLAALEWCIDRDVIRPDQVLGAFAHPSSQGGSQVDVYVGAKAVADLSPGDPVRRRADWLMAASHRMDTATRRLGGGLERKLAPPAPASDRPARLRAAAVAEPSASAATADPATALSPPDRAAAVAEMRPNEVAAIDAACAAGFVVVKINGKLSALRRPTDGMVIYIPRAVSKLQAVVHPDLASRASKAALVAGASGPAEPFHNSNLTGFPKRLNRGSKPEAFGYGYPFSSTIRLRRFLEAL